MGSGESPELGLQGRGSQIGMKNRKRAATGFQREQTPGARAAPVPSRHGAVSPAWPTTEPARLSLQTTSSSAPPITGAGERGLRRKGTVPDLLCLSPISTESVSQRPKPRETHAVPTASTVFCSPLTSDLESKRQGRPCPPHPQGPAPSAPNTNSQGKALAGNIQMSVYFLNRGASLLSLDALGPGAGR